jgi:hypothetical protein
VGRDHHWHGRVPARLFGSWRSGFLSTKCPSVPTWRHTPIQSSDLNGFFYSLSGGTHKGFPSLSGASNGTMWGKGEEFFRSFDPELSDRRRHLRFDEPGEQRGGCCHLCQSRCCRCYRQFSRAGAIRSKMKNRRPRKAWLAASQLSAGSRIRLTRKYSPTARLDDRIEVPNEHEGSLPNKSSGISR